MTLDEAEKLAREQLSGNASADSHVKQLLRADKLARFLVDILPVVKAAEEWRDHGPGQSHCDEEDCPCTSTVCRLKIAVDQMRREMEE